MLIIITAMLNRFPAPYFHFSMIIAAGQDVESLVITGLVLLWSWENRFILESICLLVTAHENEGWKKGTSKKYLEVFEKNRTCRK